MQDHARGAARAAGGPAAGVAGEHRRVAAAVDEDQALLAARQALADRGEQARRKAVLGVLAAQVDRAHHGQARARHGALGQRKALVALFERVLPGFERRRRRAEHHRAAGQLGAHHRGVASGIAQPLLLLERGVVLFVHHHESEPGQRRKDREARAEHEAGFAARRGKPGRRARHVLQCAVQQRDARFRESGLKARLELRGEADLGNQHQRLAAALQHACDESQVHLGFAASGHTVKQERPEHAERSADPFYRADLGGRRCVVRHEARRHGWRGGRLAHLLRQRLQRTQPRRQRADHRLAQRPLIVGGEKAHEFQPRRGQARRVVEHARHAFQLRGIDLAVLAFFEHHAHPRARAEGNHDAITNARRATFVGRIVENRCQRHVQRDAQHRHRRHLELNRCIANARVTLAAERHFSLRAKGVDNNVNKPVMSPSCGPAGRSALGHPGPSRVFYAVNSIVCVTLRGESQKTLALQRGNASLCISQAFHFAVLRILLL